MLTAKEPVAFLFILPYPHGFRWAASCSPIILCTLFSCRLFFSGL